MFRGQHLLSQVSWGLFASRIPWSFKNSIWGLLLVRVRGTWEQHHPTLSNPWSYMVFHAVLRTLVPKISAIWSQQPRANSSAPSGMSRELIFMLDRLNLRVFLLAYLVWTLIHFFARIGRGGSCELYPDPDPLLQRLRCFWPSIFPYEHAAWVLRGKSRDPRHCLKVTFFQDKLSAPKLCMGHARDTGGDMPMFSIMPGFPWFPYVPFFTAMLGTRQQRCHWCQECPIYDEFDWNMPGITTLIVLATLVIYAVVAGLYTGLVPC